MEPQKKDPPDAGVEFIYHRMLQPDAISKDRKNLPGPLNWQAYKNTNQYLQTRVCTRLAMRYYNKDKDKKDAARATKGVAKDARATKGVAKNARATKGVAKDSHMFILGHTDTHSFWHVYFRATVADRSTPFFAELKGEKEPSEVTMCKIVDKYNGSVDVCAHCWGGIRHPVEGGFVGFLGPVPEGPTDHEEAEA